MGSPAWKYLETERTWQITRVYLDVILFASIMFTTYCTTSYNCKESLKPINFKLHACNFIQLFHQSLYQSTYKEIWNYFMKYLPYIYLLVNEWISKKITVLCFLDDILVYFCLWLLGSTGLIQATLFQLLNIQPNFNIFANKWDRMKWYSLSEQSLR